MMTEFYSYRYHERLDNHKILRLIIHTVRHLWNGAAYFGVSFFCGVIYIHMRQYLGLPAFMDAGFTIVVPLAAVTWYFTVREMDKLNLDDAYEYLSTGKRLVLLGFLYWP